MSKKLAVKKGIDKSPKVFQREKLSQELHIRERDDLTEKQIEILKTALAKDTRCIFLNGVFGSGKTWLSVLASLKLLNQKKVDQIIYVRNPVESSSTGKMGFLKGPQPEYAKILTPDGWTTMGEIQKGDVVCTPDGENVSVLDKFELGERSVYKLTTLDGRCAYASEDHAWEVLENNKPGRFNKPMVVSTAYIRDNLRNRHGKFKITLPDLRCLDFPERYLPIDPYVLGVLLGDGHMGDHISFSNIDDDIIEKVSGICRNNNLYIRRDPGRISYSIGHSEECGNKQPFQVLAVFEDKTTKTFDSPEYASHFFNVPRGKIQQCCRENKSLLGTQLSYVERKNNFSNPLKNEILKLGLLHKRAWEKFIPDVFKFSSKEQRLEILRGLMDTDGNICGKNGESTFNTTSLQLAEDVKELVRSLGGKASISSRDRIGRAGGFINGREIISRRIAYVVNVALSDNPFFCRRKAERFQPKGKWSHRTKFKSVEYVGKERCWCIKIDSKRALYLTDGLIPTHNTLEEKLEPYASIIYDKLEELLPPQEIELLKQENRVEAIPLGFCRGKSWNCKAVIVDEASCISYEDAILLISRCGEFTRIFFIGDEKNQADIKSPGLEKMMAKFDDDISRENGIFCYELYEKQDVVRSGFLRFVLEHLGIIK